MDWIEKFGAHKYAFLYNFIALLCATHNISILLYCQDRCDGNSEQGQEAASWPREPAGQAYGTGFLYNVQEGYKVQGVQGVQGAKGYKVVQGSKLSMYKHSLANINNRF